MLVEQRTYVLYPGKLNSYLDLYEKEGLEIQKQILGHLVGYFVAETGPLNTVVHMWGYDTYEERARRRTTLFVNDVWLAYIPKIIPMIQSQHSVILRPTAFSPII